MSKYNKEYQRAYYLKHREKIRKQQNEHRNKIKDDPEFKRKNYEKMKAWCKANPEKRRAQRQRWWVRRKARLKAELNKSNERTNNENM